MDLSTFGLGDLHQITAPDVFVEAAKQEISMKFKVGDVCITQNTLYPLLNDGHRVEIIAISRDFVDQNGDAAPYEIKRVDGESHARTVNIPTRVRSWYKYDVVNCAEYKLRLAPPPQEDLKAVLECMML